MMDTDELKRHLRDSHDLECDWDDPKTETPEAAHHMLHWAINKPKHDHIEGNAEI
jgi:hypothetical protein